MRAVLLIRFGSSDMVKGDLSEEDFTFISKIAADKNIEVSSESIIKLLDAYTATGKAYIATLPLELALVEICK